MGLLPMDIEILPPYDDRIFKKIMTAPEAAPALLYVASAIIKRPVVNVLVRSNELPVTDTDEKAVRFDINCLIDDDSQADIEMQSSRMQEEAGSNHENLRARSIYNLCDLHSSQSSKGKSYDVLIRSYQVMFCGYTVFPHRTDFINTFSMRHDIDNGLLHDAVQVQFVELSKLKEVLKKPVEQMTDMEKIAVFLRYAENPDYREIVNRVIESKEGLAVAGDVLMSISQDEREKAILRNRRIYLADLESNRVTAERNLAMAKKIGEEIGEKRGEKRGEKIGEKIGEKRGEKAKALEIAKNALQISMPINDIAKLTGLTNDEVEALRDADLNNQHHQE